MNYLNKTALVTGGSSGIGLAIAKELARRGSQVIIVGRDTSNTEDAIAELAVISRTSVRGITVDLSQAGAIQRIQQQIEGQPIDILVNCAGFGTAGEFYMQDAAKERDEIAVNVVALTDLIHVFLPAMIERRSGVVLNIASTAAFQPLARAAVYAATKSYVLSLSIALHQECKSYGVQVAALCPGMTRTKFFDKANWHTTRDTERTFRTVEQVANTAMQLIESARPYRIDGLRNTILAHFARLIGPSLSARLSDSFMRSNHN